MRVSGADTPLLALLSVRVLHTLLNVLLVALLTAVAPQLRVQLVHGVPSPGRGALGTNLHASQLRAPASQRLLLNY